MNNIITIKNHLFHVYVRDLPIEIFNNILCIYDILMYRDLLGVWKKRFNRSYNYSEYYINNSRCITIDYRWEYNFIFYKILRTSTSYYNKNKKFTDREQHDNLIGFNVPDLGHIFSITRYTVKNINDILK